MVPLGWLDVSEINFNALLLLEPIHGEGLASGYYKPTAQMGTALKANPSVEWYLRQIHPPVGDYLDQCLALANPNPTPVEIRQAEIDVMNMMQDWLIYVLDPAKYDELEFLKWDDDSLLSMADFKGKVVVDIGAGTGRLAFTAAPLASVVYAVEPVSKLRQYIWEKRDRLGLDNIFPLDGTITQIPLPDDFADIIMVGHVFGDFPKEECDEMIRVVRSGGMILLHPGTNNNANSEPAQYLVQEGFEFAIFEEPGVGTLRKYWKTIEK
jgi:SAM-dependent methyltransferase